MEVFHVEEDLSRHGKSGSPRAVDRRYRILDALERVGLLRTLLGPHREGGSVLPRWGSLQWYVASTALAGTVMLAWALPRVSLSTAVTAIVAVGVAEAFAVRIRDDVDVSLSNIVILAVILVSGPETAVVATLGIVPSVAVRASDQRVLRLIFNAAQFALSAAAGGFLYHGLAGAWGVAFPSGASIAVIAAASVTFSLTNYILVSGVITTATPDPFWATFWSTVPAMMMQVPSALGIAIVGALLLQQSPFAVLFVVIPILVARYALLAFQRLENSYDELVRGFVTAIELKDQYTRGHSERVAELSVLVAEELGVPYEQRRLTRYAALLHDVGKVGVPLCVINKPGPLDDDEFAHMQKHPTIGAEILRDIDFLEPAIDIVRFHHERLDGKGYPHGVKEEKLSDIVRIVTTVDAFDAMTSTRSYRQAMSVDAAVAELHRCAGRQFDPRMVEALSTVVERVGWEPTTDFASAAHLHGEHIPVGTAQERMASAWPVEEPTETSS
jgi:putative nucleotidyltransferase with HDIG domain